MEDTAEDMFIDAHTHRWETLAGSIAVVCLNSDEIKSRTRIRNEEGILFSCGLHPWDIGKADWKSSFEDVSEIASSYANCIAVGEAGLDRCIELDLDFQREVFLEHVYLSERLQKPLIIHCVRAYSEVMEIRKQERPKQNWILHGFAGNTVLAGQLTKQGIFLSFGHALFRHKPAEALKSMNPDYILFETDDSDIRIEEVYEKASDVLGIGLDKLKRLIKANFERAFGISLEEWRQEPGA